MVGGAVTALALVGVGAWAVTSQSDKTPERGAAADRKAPKPTPKRTSTVGDVAWQLPAPRQAARWTIRT
ncbi:hypothetical protein ABZ353_09555 [Streptomyces niveus]|uniref:Uncharacterized protein n=2 Tax=Streptomyces niveus TaxID=193462 RepID=A0A1U9R271_STRNV|nr:hypothetical protein BBN63_34445 [Streptomyces niveus]